MIAQQHEVVKAATTTELITTTVETAHDVLFQQLPHLSSLDPTVLYARIELAQAEQASERSPEQKRLVHFYRTIDAVSTAAEKGLLANLEDVEDLSDALMYASIDPYAATKYLAPANTKLERALQPRELINILGIHAEYAGDSNEGQPDVSIATLARVADQVGVTLNQVEPISDIDLSLIDANLERYSSAKRTTVFEDDPVDGVIAKDHYRKFDGSDIVETPGVNATYTEEFLLGSSERAHQEAYWNNNNDEDAVGRPITIDASVEDTTRATDET